MVDDKVVTNPIPAPEKVLRGDAGTAATRPTELAQQVVEEAKEKVVKSAMEEALAAVTGTEEDLSGRIIPMGEIEEDPMFQAVARFFEIHERNYKDAAHDVGFIIEYLKNNVGVTSVEQIDRIFTFLRTLEDNLASPKDFDTKRYQRVYNYLILREKADAMNKALSMMERNRGNYGN